jgi:NAD(P)-dependent dehydrogenase (short-subunit alcohol dehydrogenase family)
VFVTGAGSGIGKSMAIKLAKLGCKVTLADINFEAVSKV